MRARSTTFHGNPESLDTGLDKGIAYVRDKVMPAVLQTDGCVGISMLADRETGRSIVTTSWADTEAMRNSRDGVRSMRERTAEFLGAEPEIQEWEVALMHRVSEAPDGACTRLIWSRVAPDSIEGAVDAFRMVMLPQLEDTPGFCSVSLLTSPAEGLGVSAVTFADRATMAATREQAAISRDRFVAATGVAVTDVTEFDLVLAHLRVPETA